MVRKTYPAEHIINKLREVEVFISQRGITAEVSRYVDIKE